ncbi:MAG: tyrosine-type recombinase/integrase [Solirubrobacteraceae bacterium]
MPRKRGSRWTASGYDPALGRKRHLGTFDTRREAAEAEAEWKLKARGTSRETCDHFAARWAADYPRPRESTNLHNAERVKVFGADFKGVRLADLDRPVARAWALKHRSSLPAVRAMFGDAVRDGLIPFNPFAELRLPGSKGRKDLEVLGEDELGTLAQLAFDPRMELDDYAPQYWAMILFAGYTGVRPGELFALRRDDIEGQLARVERSLSSKTRKTGPTKTGKARTIAVPPVAQDALREVPENALGLLFVSPAGCQWTQSLHHRYWSRLRLIANLPGYDFYSLRHSAATMLLERGVTPWDVAIQLGHTDGGQLVQTLYGHPSHDAARARVLAAWDAATGPMPLRSGAVREQAS